MLVALSRRVDEEEGREAQKCLLGEVAAVYGRFVAMVRLGVLGLDLLVENDAE